MSYALQLGDYTEGYRFRLQCKACNYGWYTEPADLLQHTDTHARMYLDETEHMLVCLACKKHKVIITPLIIKPKHHFVGGLG
ncbi:hypothetical protein [Kordiimonas aquimaris]|uniref:hypothetical protein n=1 Tax=Kordiimonas aquimaris TaxID=707591 RepID=UPI0021D1DAB8|nr:hypothetical protein [Kordiimonas aquimaris]